MKKFALIAAVAVAASSLAQPGWAAEKKKGGTCYSAAAIEAEQAIRYVTDLMVISTACQDTTYAEFRLRNRDAIVAYQKAMITHFRGAPAFDRWNTSIANQAAHKQMMMARFLVPAAAAKSPCCVGRIKSDPSLRRDDQR